MEDRTVSVLHHLQRVPEDKTSLYFLASLLQGKRCSVDLLSVEEHPEAIDDEARKELAREQREKQTQVDVDTAMQEGKRILTEHLGQANVNVLESSGDPAREVLQMLDKRQYDLLSLAAYGRGGFRKTILGAHVNKLVRETQVPVLVHKGDISSCERILVPVPNDHDRCTKFTAFLASLLPAAKQATITLLVIFSEEHEMFEGYTTGEQKQLIDSIENLNREELKYLDIAQQQFAEEGIETEVRGRIGDIGDQILNEAKEGRYDMMAFAPQKPNVLSSLWSGDKSLEVIRNIEISPLKFPPS